MDDLKTLIFRTDRIGDFIISCPFILSYKKKFKNDEIIVISSEYNYNYIKNFTFVNKIIPLSNANKFFKKLLVLIKMIIQLRKINYSNIIVLDGKKRSFFISLFLKGNKSILLQSKGLEFLSHIFNYKSVINYELQNQLKNFSFLASLLNFNINLDEIDIYKNYQFNNLFDFKKKYLNIHLDEKWFKKYYYSDFTDINPSSNDINIFLNRISNFLNDNYDIVITTGAKKLDVLEQYTRNFHKIDSNVSIKKNEKNNFIFFNNIAFNDLEFIVKNSSFLICCEGGVSHVSNAFDVKTIAFFEKNRLQHTKYWTGHMKNLLLYERKEMSQIINDQKFYQLITENLNSSSIS